MSGELVAWLLHHSRVRSWELEKHGPWGLRGSISMRGLAVSRLPLDHGVHERAASGRPWTSAHHVCGGDVTWHAHGATQVVGTSGAGQIGIAVTWMWAPRAGPALTPFLVIFVTHLRPILPHLPVYQEKLDVNIFLSTFFGLKILSSEVFYQHLCRTPPKHWLPREKNSAPNNVSTATSKNVCKLLRCRSRKHGLSIPADPGLRCELGQMAKPRRHCFDWYDSLISRELVKRTGA